MDRGNSIVEKENKEEFDRVDGYKGDDQRKKCNSNNYLFIQHLLKLEERWISKYAEIRRYVNGLQKTIKQRDMKIEMMEMENASLKERLYREINYNKGFRNSLSYQMSIDRMYSTSKKIGDMTIYRTEMVSVQNNDSKNRLEKVMVCNENVYNQRIYTPKVKYKNSLFQQNLINESYSPMKENQYSSKRKQLKLTSNRYDSFYLGREVEKSPVKPMKNESYQSGVKYKQTFSFSQQANRTIPYINESYMYKRIMDNIAKILKYNSFMPYQSQQRKTEEKVNPVRESRNQEESKNIIKADDERDENYLKGAGLIYGTKSVLYYEVPNKNNFNGIPSKVIIDSNKSDVILNSSGIGLDKSLQTTEQLQSLYSSYVNFDELTLATIMKKDRGVRQMTITEQTYGQRVSRELSAQGPMMMIKETGSKIQSGYDSDEEKTPKKCEISCMTVIEERSPKQKYTRHKYKSSKTITFNNETYMQYLSNLRDFYYHDFHSENKLILPHNIDIECGSLSPFESAQQTPYYSPQGSAQMIKLKSVDVEYYEKISQVGTVKRNPTSNNNKYVYYREKRNKLYLKSPYSHQIKNSANNNNREVVIRNQPKNNLSSQKVYEESINISPISYKNSSQKMEADKKSYNVSEDDPFSQLIEETNRSKNAMASQRNYVEQQYGISTEHLVRSNFERKKTRFNTKLTNLEYSLTESNFSLSEFDGSGMYGERENNNTNSNSGINKRSQLEIHRMSVVYPILEDVRNERESFKVDYEDNAVQAESEVYVRTSGNFGSNRLTSADVNKTESSYEKISSKRVSEESQREKISTSKKYNDPKQHTMKLHGKATLLLYHNSQTEPTKFIKPEVKLNNYLKPLNSTKKLSISSSYDSKLYHSNHQQQSEKYNEKEIPMKRNVQECNIKNPSSVDLVSEASSKQKKYVDTAIQYSQSQQLKKAESRPSLNHVKYQEQEHQPNPFPLPKNPSKSLIISYSRSNTSDHTANDPQPNNDWEKNNVYYRFKKTPKVYDSETKNHNRSESYIYQSTKMKQPYFDEGYYECYTESNKSNKSVPFEEVSRFTEGRPRLSTKERNAPDSKSTTLNNFKTHTHGANFYLTKPASASSSEHINTHAFKKMHKFTTESYEYSQYERYTYQYRTQFEYIQRYSQRYSYSYSSYHYYITPNIDIDGILFENSMLRSYNRTLYGKVKKPNNMEKLMQKLNTYNFSIRNKIHKKSIY